MRTISGTNKQSTMTEKMKINKHTLKNIEYGNCEPKALQLLTICNFYEINDMKLFLTTKLN